MAPLPDVRDRLKDYAAEFADLVRSGASKEQLRSGVNGKHGINHLVELFMMLPDTGQSAEFRIRE
jgi:hypothetical protein